VKDAKLAQRLAQLRPFITGMPRSTSVFWANLTPFPVERWRAVRKLNGFVAHGPGPPARGGG
jgi:hypothetical protein